MCEEDNNPTKEQPQATDGYSIQRENPVPAVSFLLVIDDTQLQNKRNYAKTSKSC